VLWVRGADDHTVSDTSAADFGYLGKTGMVPHWPGEEVYPRTAMVSQIRALLEEYAAGGGSYREEIIVGCGHTPQVLWTSTPRPGRPRVRSRSRGHRAASKSLPPEGRASCDLPLPWKASSYSRVDQRYCSPRLGIETHSATSAAPWHPRLTLGDGASSGSERRPECAASTRENVF
jgi:hypothetical protein